MIRINASTIGRNSIVNQLNKHSSSVFRARCCLPRVRRNCSSFRDSSRGPAPLLS